MHKAPLKQSCNYLGTHSIRQLIQDWVREGTSADSSAMSLSMKQTGDNQREKRWGQNAQVLVTVSQGLVHSGGPSSPFIVLSGDICVPLVRVQGLHANGQGASVRAQTAGPAAQCSGRGVSFSGGSRLSQRSHGKAKIPGRGSGKEPGSKARPQKATTTVTGSQR